MRAHFGGYFLGQLGTFVYLLHSMGQSAELDATNWPPFSIYNLVVANFWPLYWFAHFIDAEKLDAAYWRVYEIAQTRVAEILQFIELFTS